MNQDSFYYTISQKKNCATRNKCTTENREKKLSKSGRAKTTKNPRKRQNRCRFFLPLPLQCNALAIAIECAAARNKIKKKLRVKNASGAKKLYNDSFFYFFCFSFISSHGSALCMHAYRARRGKRRL